MTERQLHRVHPDKITEYQIQQAIKAGRLQQTCFLCYGEQFSRGFCSSCSYLAVCKREEAARKKRRLPKQ